MSGGTFAHGLVIGKFYPPHAGHHHLIDTAASRCARVSVVIAASTVESIPPALRAAWLREAHPQAHVTIAPVVDDVGIDYDDPEIWSAHVEVFRHGLSQAYGHVPEIDAGALLRGVRTRVGPPVRRRPCRRRPGPGTVPGQREDGERRPGVVLGPSLTRRTRPSGPTRGGRRRGVQRHDHTGQIPGRPLRGSRRTVGGDALGARVRQDVLRGETRPGPAGTPSSAGCPNRGWTTWGGSRRSSA